MAAGLIACDRGVRRYEVRGQVTDVQSSRMEMTLKHDAIPGFMDAMTMPFKVRDARELQDRRPGDLVTATLVVGDDQAYLTGIAKIGFSEIAPPGEAAPASSGFELVKPGDPVPDEEFVDQSGAPLRLSALRGQAVALTFIYTRCPLPTFCPMMDRHFASVQRTVLANPEMKGRVRLLSISFDPAYDTPAVLSRHASRLEADARVWSFLTGERDAVDRFASRFGVSIMRDEKDPRDITHNLRTAVVAPDGTLRKIFTGYDWTPDQIAAELAAVLGRTE
jgi:protein SCO1/2